MRSQLDPVSNWGAARNSDLHEQYVSDLTSTDPERRAAAIRFIDRVTASTRLDDRTRQAAESTQESVRRALGNILKTPSPGGPR